MAGDWREITDEREKYAAYLCSREWSELKRAVHERAGGKCERCETAPIDAVHHLTYIRKYAERLEDLQAICAPCHEFTHAISDGDPTDLGQTWIALSATETLHVIATLRSRLETLSGDGTRRFLIDAIERLESALIRASSDVVNIRGRMGWLRIVLGISRADRALAEKGIF